ncbi:MAG TPA: DUF192 domain-containing protein [Tabrizicola sp.]|nr:DUF192 domain-containing protein [Tabrizicola sp.]
MTKGSKPFLVASFFLGAAMPGFAEPDCREDRLHLRWELGTETFAVEIADDAAERGKGLMFRETLDIGAGMLFVYDKPQHPKFWMKNTLVALDMIFADATGTVTRVHSNAVPEDLTPIDGGPGVAFVLEINAGVAEKLGIVPGAEIRHPRVLQDIAAWPCNT